MVDHNSSCVKIPKASPALNEAQVILKTKEETHCQHFESPQEALMGPIFPVTATLPLITPLEVTQRGNTVFVTASIPAEAIITLPGRALEVKKISKKLYITQSRFLRAPAPILPGMPQDTSKLFLSGFVRKDIQYAQALNQTSSTVEGVIRDFIVHIPISGVVDLGTGLTLPILQHDQDPECEHAHRERVSLPGFLEKKKVLSPDFTEFNLVSDKLLNLQPTTELIYSQITEMDDELDRVALVEGPFSEATFTTLQEKMVIVIHVQLTFRTGLASVIASQNIQCNYNSFNVLESVVFSLYRSMSCTTDALRKLASIACHKLDNSRIRWIRR